MDSGQRQAVCQEALTWVGTPWIHRCSIRGSGSDCAGFIIGVFQAVGLMGKVELPEYERDWAWHSTREVMLSMVKERCHPVSAPQAGSIVVFRYGLTASHLGIMLDSQRVIHCQVQRGVCVDDLSRTPGLQERIIGYYEV